MSLQFDRLLLSHCLPNTVGPEPISSVLLTKPPSQPFSPSPLDNHIILNPYHMPWAASFLTIHSIFKTCFLIYLLSLPPDSKEDLAIFLWKAKHHLCLRSHPFLVCELLHITPLPLRRLWPPLAPDSLSWVIGVRKGESVLHLTLMPQLAVFIPFPH